MRRWRLPLLPASASAAEMEKKLRQAISSRANEEKIAPNVQKNADFSKRRRELPSPHIYFQNMLCTWLFGSDSVGEFPFSENGGGGVPPSF